MTSGTQASSETWVVVARLVRPQGRHGEVLADLLTDFPERFEHRKNLFLMGAKSSQRPVKLESYWLHQGRIVFKFVGVESITDAETLRGMEVAIPSEERVPLEDGAVYISDLIGCLLFDTHSEQDVGTIEDVDRESTAFPLLVVETPHHGQVLVPFAKAYDPQIDLQTKRIAMALPQGLIELNTPASPSAGGPTADSSQRGTARA